MHLAVTTSSTALNIAFTIQLQTCLSGDTPYKLMNFLKVFKNLKIHVTDAKFNADFRSGLISYIRLVVF